MRFLLLSLLALLLAVAIGSIAGSDTGYVMMTISGWKIQTSATLFVIIIFLSFISCYFIVRSLVRFFTMPKEIKKWRLHRNQRRAEKYLTQGLIHMTEGRWKKAENAFCKAAPYSRAPHVNYLYAARAAQESHSVERRDEYLRLAYHHNPDADIAVGITQAELQLSQDQTEQALATLKHLQHKQPGQIQVKQLLLNTYTDLSDWQSVLKLIPAIEKTSLYSREQIQAKQLDAYAGLLKDAGNTGSKEKLNTVWSGIPRKLQQHFYLIEVYITERLNFDDTADCELLLRNALKKQWDNMLVRLYGLVIGSDTNKQLVVAESWLQNHARDAVLLLSLGRICIRNELWGKARDYLQESIDVQAIPEAYYEFAKLHEHEGNTKEAAMCYEKGLALATGVND
ncbi:MAG: heme biosynthesis protein HemY [Proteobacteria bacterium]|nr:heme biosynthesis protein HemY [Pseudomonadota bacterium]NOG60588.1 heme biosynthesis protein HemY [Pseudomonadota bacterium]